MNKEPALSPSKGLRVVTYQQLARLHACPEQVGIARGLYPDGIPVTREAAATLGAAGCDVLWGLLGLLARQQREAFLLSTMRRCQPHLVTLLHLAGRAAEAGSVARLDWGDLEQARDTLRRAAAPWAWRPTGDFPLTLGNILVLGDILRVAGDAERAGDAGPAAHRCIVGTLHGVARYAAEIAGIAATDPADADTALLEAMVRDGDAFVGRWPPDRTGPPPPWADVFWTAKAAEEAFQVCWCLDQLLEDTG